MLDHKLEIGKVKRIRNLAVAPVYAVNRFTENVIMFDKAISDKKLAKKFKVRESKRNQFSKDPKRDYDIAVNRLIIDNQLDDIVFIVCGMTIEGKSQNRYAKHPCLVMPNSRIELPVNCAERGQGLIRGKYYDASSTLVIPSIRSGYSARSRRRHYDGDQRSSWNRINQTTVTVIMNREDLQERINSAVGRDDRLLNTTMFLKRMNPTEDYLYADRNADICKEYRDAIGEKPEDSQVGIVAGIRDGERTFYYTDIFGHHSLLERVFPKLAKSFGIVASIYEGDAEKIEKDNIAKFIANYREIRSDNKEAHPGGGELHVINDSVKGSILLYGKKLNQLVQATMRQDYELN